MFCPRILRCKICTCLFAGSTLRERLLASLAITPDSSATPARYPRYLRRPQIHVPWNSICTLQNVQCTGSVPYTANSPLGPTHFPSVCAPHQALSHQRAFHVRVLDFPRAFSATSERVADALDTSEDTPRRSTAQKLTWTQGSIKRI